MAGKKTHIYNDLPLRVPSPFAILTAMQTPTRRLRATADGLPGREPLFSDKQLARQEDILTAALAIMARHGCAGLTMGRFATALRMSSASIRHYFVDLDSILAELLARHLVAILGAFGAVPESAPNRKAALRAAYLSVTRTAAGGFTDAHRLLLRDRQTLPPDMQAEIDQAREGIGEILAGRHGAAALALLDTPGLTASHIETMLAALDPKPAQARAAAPERSAKPAILAPVSASRRDLLATVSIPRPPHLKPDIPPRWSAPAVPEPRSASP
jgi:AcrR family transcriptional regulator